MAAAADTTSTIDAAVQLLSQINAPAHTQMELMKQDEKLVRDRRRKVAKEIKQEKRRTTNLHKRMSKLPVGDVLEYVAAKVRAQQQV